MLDEGGEGNENGGDEDVLDAGRWINGLMEAGEGDSMD